MKILAIFVLLCALAGAMSQAAETTEYQPETTTVNWDSYNTPPAETTTQQAPCSFPGPCGQVPKDAKKLYFFF